MLKRTISGFTTVLLIILLVFLAAACTTDTSESVAPISVDGEALVQERCTKCHDLTRVEAARKTGEEWQSTVERMVGKGAELNLTEQEAVAQYLTETYPK